MRSPSPPHQQWLLAVIFLGQILLIQPTIHAGHLAWKIIDQSSSQPIPCRIHLYDQANKPVKPDGAPFWKDHFVCHGELSLPLSAGTYRYEVERGPEYARARGTFSIKENQETSHQTSLNRLIDLSREGWWSGDLHIHRPVSQIKLLMQAEDLHIGPVITWWNKNNPWKSTPIPEQQRVHFDQNRHYHIMGGEDERAGGALLYFHLEKPLPIQGAQYEHPSPMVYLKQARQQPGTWIDIEKPFWWDVPVWLASGLVDSIGLANNHMCRSTMLPNEAWGRPRDTKRLPPPRGNGFWTQEIYYHILNAGLRIPPSAGSASGVLPNPVGYNRVYVHTGDTLDYEAWWRGLKEGRSFVSNGPLLRVQANGQWPGHTFRSTGPQPLTLSLTIKLTTEDRVTHVEIIKNGSVAKRLPVPAGNHASLQSDLPFTETGWFLVRAIADHPRTFRFASTAPYFVERGDVAHRISRRSVRFFQDWIQERMKAIKLPDPQQRAEVLSYHEKAAAFWKRQASRANAE